MGFLQQKSQFYDKAHNFYKICNIMTKINFITRKYVALRNSSFYSEISLFLMKNSVFSKCAEITQEKNRF